ncbi:hypothetical protein V6N11_040983 [Hibiscus sabdariffa]|uniref:Uncharacterized protein n=1 Tax=Hibiscus sabdariffa TaxID=183260 RepID=A0ABR2RJI9_9ROSI
MAQNNLLSIVILLSLVSFLEIQCIAGRHLILDQNQKVQTDYSPSLHLRRQLCQMEPGQSPPKNDEDFRPTSPGHSPGVGHSLQN